MTSKTKTVPESENANEKPKELKIMTIYPTNLKWLPPANVKKYAGSANGNLEEIKSNNSINSRLWHLLEYSIPPFLDRNYHCVNVSELMKLDKNDSYQSVAAWFLCYCEAFGLQHFSSIQKKHYHRIRRITTNDHKPVAEHKDTIIKSVKSWQQDVDKVIRHLQSALALTSTPRLSDQAKKPEEILLEPCVIIQLPWNSVLYHQWLMAALAQVLLFEKQSVELRHWPLPAQLEPCAREILFLVKQLKERVMLGFVIFSRQVNIYPNVESKHPGLILDQVVLPSLATLQFLTSGKADEVLKNIKKTSWSKCEEKEEAENRVYVPKESYEVNYILKYFFDHIFVSVQYWQEFKIKEPFLNTVSSKCDDEEIIQNIIQNINSDDISKFSTFPLESKLQLTKKEKTVLQHKMKIRKLNLALIISETDVLDLQILPETSWALLQHVLSHETTRETFAHSNIYEEESHSQMQLALMHTMLYFITYNQLKNGDKDKGLVTRLYNLQLEVAELEHYARLANILAVMLETTPLATNVEKSSPVGPKTISKSLQKVRSLRDIQNRDWLWSQFPEQWRKPVSLDEKLITHTTKFPEISKEFEDRIGRIIVNTAQKCFEVYEKGGDIFEHWTTVQYLGPCYIASYHSLLCQDVVKTTLDNNIKLLHTIFQFYEEAYESWHIEIIPRKTPLDPNDESYPISRIKTDELYETVSYYKDASNIVLSGIIGQRQPVRTEVHRFQNLHIGLIEFLYSKRKGTDDNEAIFYNIISWSHRSLTIFKDLYEVSMIALNIPIPGNIQEPKIVGDIYYISHLMMSVESVYIKAIGNIVGYHTDFDRNVYQIIKDTRIKIFIMRIKLITTIIDRSEEEPPFQFVLHVMKLELRNLYNRLKEFKTWLGPSSIQYPEDLPDNPPELKLAAIHYLNNDFESLDQMLSLLLEDPQANLTFQDSMQTIFSTFLRDTHQRLESTKAKKKSGKKVSKEVASTSKTMPAKKCRNCPRTEEKRGSFLTCEKCKQQKYPDVNFFCSKSCKYAWWKAEHMAEHLEFELGIADFSHLKLDK